MKTKAEIVQRLLNEKLIDAAEAVVLLETIIIQKETVPSLPVEPYYPLDTTNPYPNPYPMWQSPFTITC